MVSTVGAGSGSTVAVYPQWVHGPGVVCSPMWHRRASSPYMVASRWSAAGPRKVVNVDRLRLSSRLPQVLQRWRVDAHCVCVVPYSVVNGWSLSRYGYPYGQENTQPIREDDWEQCALIWPWLGACCGSAIEFPDACVAGVRVVGLELHWIDHSDESAAECGSRVVGVDCLDRWGRPSEFDCVDGSGFFRETFV